CLPALFSQSAVQPGPGDLGSWPRLLGWYSVHPLAQPKLASGGEKRGDERPRSRRRTKRRRRSSEQTPALQEGRGALYVGRSHRDRSRRGKNSPIPLRNPVDMRTSVSTIRG